jgi:curved DNA-binding protein CbpA
MVQQAFTGFIALPSNSPWEVLGVKEDANHDEIKTAYREKAKNTHPDQGGSNDQMAKLSAARDAMLRRSA